MSLQVWLPFTDGTLKQQGLKNVEAVIGGNISLNDNGKLGKCATISASGGGITLPASSMTSFTECTVAFWIKINSWNTSYATFFQAGLNSTAWNNYIFGILRNNTGSNLCFTLTNSNGTSSSATYTTSNLNTAQWYHLAFTYKAGTICIYIDGVLDKTYSTTYVPNFAGITNISIGRGTNNSSYQTNCNLNDFRLYDHCLSPMEVKQVSQGLVLHYPLNRQGWGQENLVWNSNWNIHSTTPPESWVNWGSPPTREIVTIDGKNWLHVISNTTSFQGYSQNWTKRNGVGELSAGQKVTVSFTAYLATTATIAPIGIHWNNSSGTIVSQNWTTVALTTSPKRYSFTYTTPSDCVAFNIMVGDNTNTAHEVWITDIKLELGEIATPWCPNSSDALATTMGLNGIIEYDCSGFCNNGTRTGTFSWTSNTPKYSVGQYFNGSSYSKTDSGTFSWFAFDKCTVAIWMKPATLPSSWTGTFGIAHDNSSTNKSFVIGNYGGKFTVQSANGSWVNIQASNLPIDEWHHCVATLDGTTIKMYMDGELVKTDTINWGTTTVASDTRVQVGIDLPGSDEVYQGYYSDARIYATALSADDVKSLYQNSAYIDSSGNIYGAVHTEV